MLFLVNLFFLSVVPFTHADLQSIQIELWSDCNTSLQSVSMIQKKTKEISLIEDSKVLNEALSVLADLLIEKENSYGVFLSQIERSEVQKNLTDQQIEFVRQHGSDWITAQIKKYASGLIIDDFGKITGLLFLNNQNEFVEFMKNGGDHIYSEWGFTALEVRYNFDLPEAYELQKLPNLDWLNTGWSNIDWQAARQIARLKKLKKLYIKSIFLGSDGARELSELKQLVELEVPACSLEVQGAIEIAKLKNLTKLNIKENNINAHGARAILKLNNLVNLDVSSNGLGFSEIIEILKLPKLKELKSEYNHLDYQEIRQINKIKKNKGIAEELFEKSYILNRFR